MAYINCVERDTCGQVLRTNGTEATVFQEETCFVVCQPCDKSAHSAQSGCISKDDALCCKFLAAT